MPAVAVIDIGSNSLKVLVADGPPLRAVASATEEVRLSPRPGEPAGVISPDARAAAIGAVFRLLETARSNGAARIRMVATSMVRDAANGAEFCAAVRAATGLPLEVLDGEGEARGIAAGVATDPSLDGLAGRGLRIVDLGGGSLEYIATDGTGVVLEARSWPLGAVRLTRRFVPEPAMPISAAQLAALDAHVREFAGAVLAAGAPVPFVGCGGAFSVSLKIFAEKAAVSFEKGPSRLPVPLLRALRDRLAALPLAERVRIPGLPASRADILPAALTTLLAVAELGGTDVFLHSRRNLRYGLVGAMLAEFSAG